MDVERWRRVEDIYHEVVSGPDESREAALNRYCAGDPELRQEVESLLSARDDAGDFLSPENLHAPIAPPGSQPGALAVGASIGEYEILETIGSGAMGVVFRARDARLDRQVALKILPADFASDTRRVDRFRREARAASSLSHPNILTIYEIGQAGGTWFISAELIQGVTLRERLAAGKMPLPDALDAAIQCASAVEAAHQAGVIHRDIKPENIMIRPDGVVKLVDFGLARWDEGSIAAGRNRIGQLTETHAVLGTPRYMSPEQARGQKLDPRTDIFSLGAVLHEMALGRPAVEGGTAPEIFAALLGSGPLTHASPETPLGKVLSKALQRDREARYQTMSDFANDLRSVDPRQEESGFSPYRRARSFLRQRRKPLAALALAVLAAGVLPAVYRWTAARYANSDPPLSLVPLTAFAGPKDFAAFSPDGNRVAFCWDGGKGPIAARHIYVKSVASSDPVQLTFAPEGDYFPAWSPDGREIAFVRRFSRLESAAYIVPSGGGTERKVSAAGAGVSWSPDGKWLALAKLPGPAGFGGLRLLSLADNTHRDLTDPGNGNDSAPAYSPDGKWIAFLRQNPTDDIFVIPAGGGSGHLSPRRLTFDAKNKLPRLTWTGDSREVVYSTEREYGGEGLWRVRLSGGEPRRISSTLLFAGNPSISSRGDRLAYTESWIDTNIYVAEGPGFDRSGVPGRFGEPVKLIASSREDHSPNFSPDGQRIAFVSNRTGHSEIWTARRDGSGQVQLTHLESFAGTPRWSADGRWIAFDCILSGKADIYVIGADGGTPRRLTNADEPNTKPSWSRDGAWIYFNSDRSGRPEIWKVKAEGGAAVQVTRGGGREPLPSPDGRTLYYTQRLGGAPLWWVPSEGGPEQPVRGMEAYDQIGRAWGVLPEGIYFALPATGAQPCSIDFFSFATGGVSALGSWPCRAAWAGPAVALSPDGRYLLTVHTDQEINDLVMIENFR